MSEVTTSNSEDVKASVENKPMSDKDFLSARIAKLQAKTPPVEAQKPESVPKEEEPKVETTSKESDQPEAKKPEDVLSKDVDELTDDEIAELAQKGKSKLLKRIAELTAKRKLAEEKAAALESMAQQNQQPPPEIVENNPYSSINSIGEINAKRREVSEVIEWAKDVLFRSEDMKANEIVATVEGKEYTKADIRESLRKAEKAHDKFLPAQQYEIQVREQRSALEQSFKQQARKEIAWLDGEDNDTRKRYEAMVNDPRLKKMKESVPDIAPQIEYLIAHAANSMYGRKSIEIDKPKPTTLNPPSSPSNVAAAPERSESRVERSLKDVESRFKRTGSSNDFIALRSTQLSKRK